MSEEELTNNLAAYNLVRVSQAVDVLSDAVKIAQLINTTSGQCLFNAYKAAEKTKAKIIEGLVLLYINGRPRKVFGHCWNKIDDIHFDLTLDFTQSIEGIMTQGEKSFQYFEKTEYNAKKYYKKAKDGELSWFTNSMEFGTDLTLLGPERLSELFSGVFPQADVSSCITRE